MTDSQSLSSVTPFVEPLWYSRGGSPYYNVTHECLRDEVRAYVEEKITPYCAEWEAQGSVPKEVRNPISHLCINTELNIKVLREHSKRGYTAVAFNPAAVSKYLGHVALPGGINPSEWDGFHDLICIDEIARCGYLGVIWALSCGDSIGCPPLVAFGNEFQKRSFLPSVISGETRFCLGITEPDGESFYVFLVNQYTNKFASRIRCCEYLNNSRATRRCLHCKWYQKMDYQRYVGRLLHCCCSYRWAW